ncbi:MmcQ/YjbR family DNA-binding protein [Devosia faecipullorum]|uniref:MmcQ/YjbR family DNA-binding protein n=1 Tax=Devosia faecipullorum TaxID=2755039 RepID=UPI00187B6D40|nr:MmcQ/YjbR family DNA-binding protein [Devosia faecipullorum]MBE7733341.1 MmcQ/YjbR family DNA-binding protein [Devosia faecipullorum]
MKGETLRKRPDFEAFVLGLPGTMLVRQWGNASVGKLGGKVFCLLVPASGEIWLKVSDMTFEMMRDEPGIRPAPYFARAGWVAIAPESRFSDDDLRAYIEAAHRLIAGKLTRKQRAELGLSAASA